jgi:hypothetical protein
VAHVDLALSELTDPGRLLGVAGSLDLWSYPVSMAAEPCLVVDASGVVAAASPGCQPLLGIDPHAAVGRSLVGGVLHLLDFGSIVSDLPVWEADKIPPRIAATTGGLARGLMRLRGPDGAPRTVDAISVPLRNNSPSSPVVGSLTFFSLVR